VDELTTKDMESLVTAIMLYATVIYGSKITEYVKYRQAQQSKSLPVRTETHYDITLIEKRPKVLIQKTRHHSGKWK
jgi:hypothetical protein